MVKFLFEFFKIIFGSRSLDFENLGFGFFLWFFYDFWILCFFLLYNFYFLFLFYSFVIYFIY